MDYFNYTHVNYRYDLQGHGTAILDIPYSNLSAKNKIDLYIPAVQRDSYPVIIYVHGGGFSAGDKTHHITGILHGLERGYAVACINYRLNKEAPYPAFMEDVCEGVRFLKANADLYHLNKNKMAFWGDTHGGYIASAIAIMGPKGLLDSLPTKYPHENLNVCGVVTFYAPIDLSDFHAEQIKRKNIMKDSDGNIMDEITFIHKGDDLIKYLKPFCPLQYIDGTEPPFYLLHGMLDRHIPQKYTQQFSNALTDKYVPHVLNFVKNGQHAIDSYDNARDNTPIMEFFDSVFLN